MTDPRDDPPPVCPHPYGTRDYEEWWEAYFRVTIPRWRALWDRQASEQRACEAAQYGHDFSTRDQRCACGLSRLAFHTPTDDARWESRSQFLCPIPAGPIFYLDCYCFGALLGDQFPVQTYGPSTWLKLQWLLRRVGHNFDRAAIVTDTKGQGPLPEEYWPGVDRPR